MAWGVIFSAIGVVLLANGNGLAGSPLRLFGVFFLGVVALAAGVMIMFTQKKVKINNLKEAFQ